MKKKKITNQTFFFILYLSGRDTFVCVYDLLFYVLYEHNYIIYMLHEEFKLKFWNI